MFGDLRDPGEGRETGLELWKHQLKLWEHRLEHWEHRLCPAASPTTPWRGWRALWAGGVRAGAPRDNFGLPLAVCVPFSPSRAALPALRHRLVPRTAPHTPSAARPGCEVYKTAKWKPKDSSLIPPVKSSRFLLATSHLISISKSWPSSPDPAESRGAEA